MKSSLRMMGNLLLDSKEYFDGKEKTSGGGAGKKEKRRNYEVRTYSLKAFQEIRRRYLISEGEMHQKKKKRRERRLPIKGRKEARRNKKERTFLSEEHSLARPDDRKKAKACRRKGAKDETKVLGRLRKGLRSVGKKS